MKSGIYEIYNKITGQRYIGASTNIKSRWISHHRWELRTNKHKCAKLQNAWNQYGEDAFELRIIQEMPDAGRSELNACETHWLQSFDLDKDLYNMHNSSTTKGFLHSEETKNKISEIIKNMPAIPNSGQWNKGHEPWNKGKTGIYSEETCKKISDKLTGKKWSDETREKMKKRVPWNKGKTGIYSEETRKRISDSVRALGPLSEEVKKKMSESSKGQKAWNKGKTGIFSPETIEKIRASSTGRKHSPETLEKMRQAQRKRYGKE